MMERPRHARSRSGLWLGLAVAIVCGSSSFGVAQDDFRSTPSRTNTRARSAQSSVASHVPSLSESTALLESEVRNLYAEIEPGRETMPNELIAYADLRALRLYTGALEVAGWDLEQAASAYSDLNGGRRGGRRTQSMEQEVLAARERYLAFRETVRTLLYRVRSTAVAVEHQVSFCDRQIADRWQNNVVPTLLDTISATQPLFYEQDSYVSYHIPGQNATKVVRTSGNSLPDDAVEVSKNPEYMPYDGQGRGQGRYFEIRSYGGPVRVKSISYRSHENAFGVIGTSVVRELTVDQIASPSQPLYIPCNRERFVDLSELQVTWENADGRRQTYATIDVIAERPKTNNDD